ncbi:MAG: APC family permease [Blastocatellia bacterium]|nr:APC family permease [Blastocatellia bacterium]MBN8722239.1 APC family permease [Acidobacteriota bacterium]
MESTDNEVNNNLVNEVINNVEKSNIEKSNSNFAGWGTTQKIEDIGSEHIKVTHLDSGLAHKLGEWKSTAICGNDITSSCLYVSALCAIYAGPYAPVALACVAVVLYLFRNIYAEVGLALPLNGGAYNVLLNTTTKAKASIAACLTLLSYLATAVISANEAMHYAHNLWHGLNVFWATIILLGIFAILNLIGISESAIVALFLFVFHIATLVLLSFCVSILLFKDLSIFWSNWQTPTPDGILKAIFFGFSAAMLGISGFESSANFIEEQQQGVFPKTLRNMWIAVAIFNPLISLLSLGILPLSQIANHKEDLLAQMGLLSAGRWLQVWVSINAVLVLSGAVLTSYVGVTGLIRRMALDRCLPQFLLEENKWRSTNHWIILLFFALCCSVLVITGGRIETLAGVYTLSFLCVMALFAVGNMLLKIKRDRLPREIRASWGAVAIAFIAVIIGLIGNLLINPAYVRVFLIYFGIAFLVVEIMFLRVQILKAILAISQMMVEKVNYLNQKIANTIISGINQINNQTVIFFSRGDSLPTLNQAALYVLQNEQSKRLLVLHCYDTEEDIPKEFVGQLNIIDRIYPELRIDLIMIKGKFGPELIEKVSKRLKVPKNYMFIGTPSDRFPHNIAELGGVRLIM